MPRRMRPRTVISGSDHTGGVFPGMGGAMVVAYGETGGGHGLLKACMAGSTTMRIRRADLDAWIDSLPAWRE